MSARLSASILSLPIRTRYFDESAGGSSPFEATGTFGKFTLEYGHVMSRLMELGIEVVVSHDLERIEARSASARHLWTGVQRTFEDTSVVMVTMKDPITGLYDDLCARHAEFTDAGISSVSRIGDCIAPGPIAMAVHNGHQWAVEFGG